MIITKYFNDLKEYSLCHKTLLELLRFVNDFIEKEFKRDVVVTEIYRSEEEQLALCKKNEVEMYVTWHMLLPVQAIDIRTFNFTKVEINRLLQVIQDNWTCDKSGRPCALYHKSGNGAYHIHLQVCDETIHHNKPCDLCHL